MRFALRLHPDCRCDAVARIDVEVSRPGAGVLLLDYLVTGNLSELRLPPVAAPERGDGLWQHSCFEAFVRITPGASYYEFNFAPSTQWAAYRFEGYREAMRTAAEIAAPDIKVRRTVQSYALQAALVLPARAGGRLAISAVIEETGGAKSYWALGHPPGKPDFHHSDCFALELPAA